MSSFENQLKSVKRERPEPHTSTGETSSEISIVHVEKSLGKKITDFLQWGLHRKWTLPLWKHKGFFLAKKEENYETKNMSEF